MSAPKSQAILVEGLPGVGKSFIIKIIRNITRLYHNRNDADLVSAPTGAAASIIGGKTHHRNLSIPAGGKQFNALPKNLPTTNGSKILALATTLRKSTCVLNDEHSMDGNTMWGHIRHRHEELRKHHEIDGHTDNTNSNEHTHVNSDNSLEDVQNHLPTLPTHIASRPFGGYQFFYSFGDFNQLPPVGQTAVLKYNEPIRGNTCDTVGRIAFSDFINPPPTANLQSTIVFMEDVKRTTDRNHLDFCDKIRRGTLTLLACLCSSNLLYLCQCHRSTCISKSQISSFLHP